MITYVLFLTHREARSLLGGLEREEIRHGGLTESRTQIKKRLTDMLGGEDWRTLPSPTLGGDVQCPGQGVGS